MTDPWTEQLSLPRYGAEDATINLLLDRMTGKLPPVERKGRRWR